MWPMPGSGSGGGVPAWLVAWLARVAGVLTVVVLWGQGMQMDMDHDTGQESSVVVIGSPPTVQLIPSLYSPETVHSHTPTPFTYRGERSSSGDSAGAILGDSQAAGLRKGGDGAGGGSQGGGSCRGSQGVEVQAEEDTWSECCKVVKCTQ